KQWGFISRVEIRPRHAVGPMTLRAIGGEVGTRALFQTGGGVCHRNDARERWNVGFIERRIEKAEMIPGAQLVVSNARVRIAVGTVELMRLDAQDVLRDRIV